MGKLKEWLKRYMPQSSKTATGRHFAILERLEQIEKKMIELEQEETNRNEQLSSFYSSLVDQVKTSQEELVIGLKAHGYEEREALLKEIQNQSLLIEKKANQFFCQWVKDNIQSVLEAHWQRIENLLNEHKETDYGLEEKLLSGFFDAYCQWEEACLSNRMEAQQKWEHDIFRELVNILEVNFREILDVNKIYYWTNTYERQAVTYNWGELTKDPNIKQKYLRLVAGLDDESINIVNRIIHRQSIYLNSDSERIDLFTYEEQQQLHRIQEIFSKEVVRIADDMYAFRHYLLPINHFEAVSFYYKYCIPDLSDTIRLRGKTIVDAGGYIGDSALIFAELNPERIIIFEPVPENLELLRKTVKMNNLTNATIEELALGDKSGELEMHVAGEGSTSYPRQEDYDFSYYSGVIRVPVISLDEYLIDKNLEIGLIKADIEGSEQALLRGAYETIKRQRPTLLICIYHNSNDFFEIKSMIEEWDLGYQLKIRKPVVENATYEALLIAEILEKD